MDQAQNAPKITLFSGPRLELLSLFLEADDSASEVQAYFEQGEVLVATDDGPVLGYVQLICAGSDAEIKSVAVIESRRGNGVGTALLRAACARAATAGARRVMIATAAAGIEQLRLYQRLGFRMERVVRDYFNDARGYPPHLTVNGIPLRDQVWLSLELSDRS
jgi:ribosomal protein S18 acetylase RimI-like enzyme